MTTIPTDEARELLKDAIRDYAASRLPHEPEPEPFFHERPTEEEVEESDHLTSYDGVPVIEPEPDWPRVGVIRIVDTDEPDETAPYPYDTTSHPDPALRDPEKIQEAVADMRESAADAFDDDGLTEYKGATETYTTSRASHWASPGMMGAKSSDDDPDPDDDLDESDPECNACGDPGTHEMYERAYLCDTCEDPTSGAGHRATVIDANDDFDLHQVIIEEYTGGLKSVVGWLAGDTSGRWAVGTNYEVVVNARTHWMKLKETTVTTHRNQTVTVLTFAATGKGPSSATRSTGGGGSSP